MNAKRGVRRLLIVLSVAYWVVASMLVWLRYIRGITLSSIDIEFRNGLIRSAILELFYFWGAPFIAIAATAALALWVFLSKGKGSNYFRRLLISLNIVYWLIAALVVKVQYDIISFDQWVEATKAGLRLYNAKSGVVDSELQSALNLIKDQNDWDMVRVLKQTAVIFAVSYASILGASYCSLWIYRGFKADKT